MTQGVNEAFLKTPAQHANVTVAAYYRDDSSHGTCVLYVGEPCAVPSPYDPFEREWFTNEGRSAALFLEVRVEWNGGTILHQVVAIPLAGQAIGGALP